MPSLCVAKGRRFHAQQFEDWFVARLGDINGALGNAGSARRDAKGYISTDEVGSRAQRSLVTRSWHQEGWLSSAL